jgi:hypothetical protein
VAGVDVTRAEKREVDAPVLATEQATGRTADEEMGGADGVGAREGAAHAGGGCVRQPELGNVRARWATGWAGLAGWLGLSLPLLLNNFLFIISCLLVISHFKIVFIPEEY